MALRFPIGGARLMGALKDILPKTGPEWAWRLGPEAGFALMGAAMAPSEVSGPERAGLAAEDFLLGLGTSLAGAGLGRLAFGMKYPRSSMSPAAYAAAREKNLSSFVGAGDVIGAPMIMLAPRPFASAVYQRAYEQQSRREQEETEKQVAEQNLLSAALTPALAGSGALFSSGFSGMPPIGAVI